MKILVPIKRVIDYTVNIRVKPDGSGVETQHVKMSMNPFDAIALEEAIRLREKNIASEIIALSIGQEDSQETLRQALAIGADRAILYKTDQIYEPFIIAKILENFIKKNPIDLVIMGKQAIDDDCNQTGQMLAGFLNWPQGAFISSLMIENQQAHITREIDSGLEKLSLTLPCVLTTDLRLNEPRLATLPNIMRAKQKPLEILSIEIDSTPHMEILETFEPPKRQPGVILNSIEELIGILK